MNKELIVKGLSVGIITSSMYTGAYMAVSKPACQHASFDPIMGAVRGITGAIIGGYLGSRAANFLKAKLIKEDKNE